MAPLVRSALIDNPPIPELTPLSFVVGVRKLPRLQYQTYVDLVSGGCHFICAGDYCRIFTAMRDVTPDQEEAEYIWYVTWLNGRPEELLKLNKEELLEMAKSKVDKFAEPFRSLIWDTPREVMCFV